MGDRRQSSSKIFISSSDKSSWVSPNSNTRLNVNIDPFILHNNDPAHFVIGLESFSCPIAINMIHAGNNTLQFKKENNTNFTSLTIPAGNYNTISLIDTLNAQLTDDPAEYVFGYDSDKNKITLTALSTTQQIEIGSSTTAYKVLGVEEGTALRGTVVGVNMVYEFENLVNLVTTSGIIVRLLNFQTENRGNQDKGTTTLTRIPINVQPFRYLSFYIENPFYTSVTNRHISNIELELCDDNYNQLDLIGNPDYFITLRLDYIEPKFFNHEPTKLQILREQSKK